MGSVPNGYFQAVLKGISAPVDTENLRACHAWQLAEGGKASFNAFNTTQDEPGCTWYNTFGSHGQYHVKNYKTEQSGIDATVKTLLNGHYGSIVGAFRTAGSGYRVCQEVDASVWGTHGAERVYANLYGSGSTQPANPPASTRRVLRYVNPLMHGSDVRQTQEALIRHGYNVGKAGPDGYYGQWTANAVAALEQHVHLTPVDGVAGPKVYHALGLS